MALLCSRGQSKHEQAFEAVAGRSRRSGCCGVFAGGQRVLLVECGGQLARREEGEKRREGGNEGGRKGKGAGEERIQTKDELAE